MRKDTLETLDSKVFITSSLYYEKEELAGFVKLFSSLVVKDQNLANYVKIIRELYTSGRLDNLPKIPEQRKLYLRNEVIRRASVDLTNAIDRKKFTDWIQEAYAEERDIELQEELLYRYCWSEFVDRVQKEDLSSKDFRDKLSIKPVVPEMANGAICSLEEIEILPTKESKEVFPTGIKTLDEKVKMKRTNFVVVAARTTVGKSLFMINQAVWLSNMGQKILYVSLEESKEELKKRVITHIGMDKGKQERVFKNFLIYNPTTSSPDPIFDELESTLKERNIAVIFIDYIQLMKYPKMQDFDSLRVLTRELKLFALRNNVCLITASQTRREAEVLGSSLSTLFGSSTIENDANIIMFLERERAGSERVRMSNIVPINIMISKNRSGEQGVVNTEVDYSNGHIIDRTC